MVKQDLRIGDVTLEGVLTTSEEVDVARIEEIKRLVDSRGETLAMEKVPIEKLIKQKTALEARLNFPQLDVSFLSMSNITRSQDRNIQVPRFSVYGLDNNVFSMNVRYDDGAIATAIACTGAIATAIAGGTVGLAVVGAAIAGGTVGLAVVGAAIAGGTVGGVVIVNYYSTMVDVSFPNLPRVFTNNLVKATEFSRYAEPNVLEWRERAYRFKGKDIPRKVRKKYKVKDGDGITLTSRLNGLVPTETRERIMAASKVFSRENLYMIAETKSEEWSVTKLVIDPLVVGVLDDKCFYVDRFNTTKIEEYVSREFK